MDYSLSDIARICGGKFSGRDARVDTVMTDSRHSFGAQEHPLFVAIKGVNHDGHAFIGDLYRRGVRAFMVEREVDASLYPGACFVKVEHSLRALQALASDHRGNLKGLMVGITGSAGKTTVKEWIARNVPQGMKVFRSPRSYNSQLGVPLSVLMMSGDEDVCLIEAGISRPGEMERLAAVIRPDIGIFTGLGPEHSENFDSDEQKAGEKSKLFVDCPKIIFDGSALIKKILEENIPAAKLIDAYEYLDESSFPDRETACNAALVASFYEATGMPLSSEDMKPGGMESVSMRLDIREGLSGSVIIADHDNTDVNSLAIALDYTRKVAAGRPRMVILSDILFSRLPEKELYEKAASLLRDSEAERFIGIGEQIYGNSGAFGPGGRFYRTVAEFIRDFSQKDTAGYAVLVKGNPLSGFDKIVHQLERRTHTTVLEIDLDAMIHNLDRFRSRLKQGTGIMAMVKASGYGNGTFEVANMLQGQGVDYLAVAFADEGVRLREQGITMPVVVLNADSDSFGLMIANRLEPEIYSMGSLKAFIAALRESGSGNYPVHIKIDSGMHRLGFEENDIPELIGVLLKEGQYVKVRSVFSHLAAADVHQEDGFTLSQIALFDKMSSMIADALGRMPLRHIANSAGAERFPQAVYDMVRLGIGLYGISTGSEEGLRSVSRLLTRIVQIKELEPGQSVGYGRAGRIIKKTRLATIPVGYADGFDRRLGEGRWSVQISGKPCPTVGRVSMDSCVVDITGVEASEGSEVMVFGGQGRYGVAEMAVVLGTIPYEIMTSVSDRVKRIFIKE